jgi:acyl-CoA synthetase (AMP-forming)/AMP-acid ligase II
MERTATQYRIEEVTSRWGHKEKVYAERSLNLAEVLANTAAKHGDSEGIISPDSRLSYGRFASMVDHVSSGLYRRYGVRKGDRVALMLKNGWAFSVSFFAVMKLGAVAVPLNTAYKGEEAAFQLSDSGSVMVIVDPEFHEVINEIRPRLGQVRKVFVTDSDEYRELLKQQELDSVHVQVDETDSAVIMYTSGTTGRPKGAVLTHRGMIAEAMSNCELFDWRPGRDRHLCPVPLFHVTGLAMNLCGSVYAGIPVVFMDRFTAPDALKIIEEEKITTMIGVPTVLWLMLNVPEYDYAKLKTLRGYGAGGSASPVELLNACREKLPGLKLCPGYGLSEASGMVMTTVSIEDALSHIGSAGRALPLVETRIVDTSQRELPPGEPGELLVRGCLSFKEYWNNPEATREIIEDGWVHTGDIARKDEEGYIYILDRMKDMINRGGEKIWSLEVENLLYRHPKILEAAVVGVPDPIFGEEVKAVVALRTDAKATAEEIQEFCRRSLARYKVPKFVEFRESLPRNPAGKVIKRYLK